jgi:signal transduction histidine kinase
MLRSTVLRLTIGFVILFVTAALVLALYIYWATAGTMSRQIDKTILTQADALLQRHRSDGVGALTQAIEIRLIEEADEDEILLLVDSAGRVVAGNLDAPPSPATNTRGSGTTFFDAVFTRDRRESTARMMRVALASGHTLYVGRDVQLRLDLRGLITDALFWAIGVTVALAIVGGLLARRVLIARLHRISAVADRVVAGDLTPRVEVTGSGDEFDRLSGDINVMLDRLGELMDGVRQVSNAIAHDLRTPLARLRGRLDAALAAAGSPAEFRAAAETAILELDQVVRIFDALLRIAEIEAGHRRAEFQEVDLAAVIADVVELYQPLAEARGLTMEIVDGGAASCVGDRTMLAQALANLVDNAIKYTPFGGRIAVSARRDGSNAVATVADTGPGIPATARAKVGSRFFRLEESRNSPGSGLGLSLVFSVAKLHGGELKLADNAPGLRAELLVPQSA